VQYLDAAQMAAVFARAGIRQDDEVIVYADGKEVLGATMVAYALQRTGHVRVAVMNGGLEAYRTRHPLVQEYPDPQGGDLTAADDPDVRIGLDELRSRLGKPGLFLLDTRPPADYLGNTSRWIRNGHIPGARNLEWRLLMQPGNLHAFRPLDEMARLIESTGAQKSDDVVVYCGTSREATLVYEVMRHLLGYPKVRLYEGSWTEYCSKPELPIEREGWVVTEAFAKGMAPGKAGTPASVALASVTPASVTPASETPAVAVTLDARTADALRAALDDERRAEAYYRAVMDRFGTRRPFSNIIEAEQRHQALLLARFESHGLEVPENRWESAKFDVPPTFADACASALEYEKENVAMYDRLLAFIDRDDIRDTMVLLRRASADHHIPAFQRFVRSN